MIGEVGVGMSGVRDTAVAARSAVRGASASPSPAARRDPLRIALVRQKYRPDGGGERIVRALISVLQESGHEVAVIARDWTGGDVPVIRCDPPRVGRVLRERWFAGAAMAAAGQGQFDVVQSHERIPGCQIYRAGDGVHAEWLRQRRRILSPPARWWLAASPYHRYLLRTERALLEHPRLRLVICNSRMVMEEIRDRFPSSGSKLRLVYNGVDTERFHPRLRCHRAEIRARLGIPAEARLFLFVGSGFERKGLLQGLAALRELPRAHLVAVGQDKRMDWYRQTAARWGLGCRLHLAGVQQDVGPYYGAADALLLPAIYDPFPNVILEAMAAGLPVITSTKCGGAELIQESASGYVCDALDRPALVRAMRRLMDPEHGESLGLQARRTVEPLTMSAMRDRLLEIYREFLDGRD